jgi:ATP-binding cassette, subfamily C (CFTR/MRP), member 1
LRIVIDEVKIIIYTIFFYLIIVSYPDRDENIAILCSSKYVAAAMPFVLVELCALQIFYLRTSRQMKYIDLEAKSPFALIFEALGGIPTIRAFRWPSAFHTTNLRLLDLSQRPFYLLYCIQQWLNLVLNMIVAALAVLLVAFAIEMRNTTSSGLVGVALLNILTLRSNLAGLITYWTALGTSLGAIARLRDFERNTPQEVDGLGAQIPAENWPATGLLEFKDTTVSYSCVQIYHDLI